MNENIDLTKILKNCPEGTEFWSDNYGKVKFLCIDTNLIHPIRTIRTDGGPSTYTKEGWYRIDFPASCLLWPSKDCRDWSKFTAPWYTKEKFDPKTLKPFDKVLVRDGVGYKWNADFYSYRIVGRRHSCVGDIYDYCIPYNDDTKYLLGTSGDAPDFYRYWEE